MCPGVILKSFSPFLPGSKGIETVAVLELFKENCVEEEENEDWREDKWESILLRSLCKRVSEAPEKKRSL